MRSSDSAAEILMAVMDQFQRGMAKNASMMALLAWAKGITDGVGTIWNMSNTHDAMLKTCCAPGRQ